MGVATPVTYDGKQLSLKGKQLVGVLWFECSLSISFIALRFYTRRYVGGAVGLDDWILLLCWAFMLGFAACCTVSVMYGMGTHADELTTNQQAKGMLWLLIGQFLISISIGLSKCAVAVFLVRIVNQTWHKLVLYFCMTTMMILSLLLAISVFAQCTPVQSIWDSRVEGTCTLSLSLIAKVTCSWAAIMDFFLAFFPWLVLWKLNMKKKEKITICVSLSLGILAGACGVVRTTTLDSLNDSTDYLYAVSDSVMWTQSELAVTIICVSIPALRPLYNKLTGGSSTGGPYQNYGGYGGGKNPASRGDDVNLQNMQRSAARGQTQYDVDVTRGDNDSDTCILQDSDAGLKDGGIHRHQEVTVSYDDNLSATTSKQPTTSKLHV